MNDGTPQHLTPPQSPPAPPIETVTKDELRTYYPTKEDLATLKGDLRADITNSQMKIIGVMIAYITIATVIGTAIIGFLVRQP